MKKCYVCNKDMNSISIGKGLAKFDYMNIPDIFVDAKTRDDYIVLDDEKYEDVYKAYVDSMKGYGRKDEDIAYTIDNRLIVCEDCVTNP